VSIYLDEFETLYGISDNVEKLRNKILELAFKGELTKELNINQFEAKKKFEDLLKKRKTMIKNKEIRKPRKPRGKDFEKPPFSIPKQWLWVKLIDSIGTMTGPKKLKKKDIYDNGAIPVVSQSQDLIVGYTNDEEAKLNIKNPLIIFGDHTTNIKFIDFDFAVGSDGVKILKPIIMTEKLFYYYLKLININQDGYKRHFSKLKTKLIPLIPLEEQKIIVDKIEKLMKEVDKLEIKLKEKEDVSQDLSESIVEAIKNSTDAEELKENLRFIIDNFDVIFKTSESMDEMRNIVLQLAIEGKLVQQDENDESASKLIDKIEKEKKELIKKGKIKDNNRYSIEKIKEIEIPFEIPKSWRWIRSNTLFKEISYGYTASAIKNKTATKLLRISDIQNGKVNWEDVPHCKIEEKDVEKYILKNNDIVIARTGGTVGKSYKIKNINTKAVFASYLIRKVLFEMVNSNYYYLFLQSPLYWEQLIDGTKGAAQPNVNATVLSNLLIPLPPLKEQKKIVQKVNSIMSIIDKLEKELIKKEDLVEKLGSI